MSMFDLKAMGGAYRMGGAVKGSKMTAETKMKLAKGREERQSSLKSIVDYLMATDEFLDEKGALKLAKEYLKQSKKRQLKAQKAEIPRAPRAPRETPVALELKQRLFGRPEHTITRGINKGKIAPATPNFIKKLTEEQMREVLTHINTYGAGFWEDFKTGFEMPFKAVSHVAPLLSMLL
jgi:hypothetical protein